MGILNKLISGMMPKPDPGDAARFARLLVAEIRLTEPYKWERGMKQNDICGSLEIEIERARAKFRSRFPQNDIAAVFDVQLIDVLADGDPTKLGSKFGPGSKC